MVKNIQKNSGLIKSIGRVVHNYPKLNTSRLNFRCFAIIFVIVLSLPSQNHSQDFHREINTIPFFENSQRLDNVFSGGTNNIEHQFVDIDSDNDYDLFVLNSDGAFEWFENTGTPEKPDFKLSGTKIPGLELTN